MADLTRLTPQELLNLSKNVYDTESGGDYIGVKSQVFSEIERRLLRAQQAEKVLNRFVEAHARQANDESAREVETCPCTICREARAALGERPPTPTMSREEAERMAKDLIPDSMANKYITFPEWWQKRIADVLQSVARGERP